MSATQGVILVMVGVLLLYLFWARKSPLNQGGQAPGSGNGSTTPPPPAADPLPPHEVT